VHAIDGARWLATLRASLQGEADQLPAHRQFIDSHCRADA
jgi:hypothetical protein